MNAYDLWKLDTPSYFETSEEHPICECAACRRDLFAGYEVITDNKDNYFCDHECAEKYVKLNIENYLHLFNGEPETILSEWDREEYWNVLIEEFLAVEIEE